MVLTYGYELLCSMHGSDYASSSFDRAHVAFRMISSRLHDYYLGRVAYKPEYCTVPIS
jgi:hypothetical protein